MGRQCVFIDRYPELIDNYPSNRRLLRNYILRDPVSQGTQEIPIVGVHDINTFTAKIVNTSVNHTEGGWPKDVNLNDEEAPARYRRKVQKEDAFNPSVIALCKRLEGSILQNNAVDIYQKYYSDVENLPVNEPNSARTVNVYENQNKEPISASHISWSPDGDRIAISYSSMDYQKMSTVIPNTFIFDIDKPNLPLFSLKPLSVTLCLEYHFKDHNLLVSGQENGRVAFWDIRKGDAAVAYTTPEYSHRDVVLKTLWIASKTGRECFSCSPDGQVKWWDVRKLDRTLENLIVDARREEDQSLANALGVHCIEYEYSVPTKFMIGTQDGRVISCNRKGKNALEKMGAKYHAQYGPVMGLQRNPFFVKCFLTVGDWSSRIFTEECKESPIMWTSYERDYLNDCTWSPTRCSAFFTARSDGVVNVWDILNNQKKAILGIKVCDSALKTIRIHPEGKRLAVGDQRGTTYLVEISDSLTESTKSEKMLFSAMIDRETKKEKLSETRNRELRLKMKTRSGEVVGSETEVVQIVEETKDLLAEAEEEYYLMLEQEKAKYSRNIIGDEKLV